MRINSVIRTTGEKARKNKLVCILIIPYGMSNYQEFKKQIQLFFDNELDNENKEILLSRIDSDPKCHSMFKKERNFRDFVKNNIKRSTVSSDLVQSIKSKLTNA